MDRIFIDFLYIGRYISKVLTHKSQGGSKLSQILVISDSSENFSFTIFFLQNLTFFAEKCRMQNFTSLGQTLLGEKYVSQTIFFKK